MEIRKPSVSDLDPWISLNATMFRFPVLWNYIQPIRRGPLDTRIIQTLDNLIKYVTDKNMYAILDIVSLALFRYAAGGSDQSKSTTMLG